MTVAVNQTSPNSTETTAQGAVLQVAALPAQGPWPTLDPFLFCVHHNDDYPKGNGRFGPKASLGGRSIGQDFSNKDGWSMYHGQQVPGFPRHPHRGFETITLVDKGVIDHADSMGAAARYGDGDVQWLTAGDGINHAEMFPLLKEGAENPMDFFQIWINLPAKNKRAQPNFTMFWREDVPVLELKDPQGKAVRVRVVAGSLLDKEPPAPPPASWASEPGANVAVWTIELEAGAKWTMPGAEAGVLRTLYTVSLKFQQQKSKKPRNFDRLDRVVA